MAYGAANYNQSSGKSNQSSGLTPYYRRFFSEKTPGEYSYVTNLSREAQADPGGLAYQSTVDQLLPVGRYGLPTAATEGTYQLGRDLFTQASGSRVRRGFNSPNNLEAVLGDAVRMASGQLIPLSTNFALERAKAAPALRQAAFGYGMTPMQTLEQLINASSAGTSSQSSFGFGLAGAGSDRRLKSNIVRIGRHPLGIGWYKYTIYGINTEGVMADELLEVMPEAVSIGSDGYYRVNYNLAGRVG